MLKKDVRVSLILKSTVKGLGTVGDLVKVRPGYARNSLLAKGGKAIWATKENISAFEKQREDVEKQRSDELSLAQSKFELIKAVGGIAVTHNASEDGKLFGSVTNKDIVNLLKDKGIEVSARDVFFKGSIKHTGEYNINIYLHPHVSATITLRVEKR